MEKKIKIAILMGGPSSEHEVSLETGKMILKTLDKNKYEPVPVLISKKCLWKFPDEKILNELEAVERLKRENVGLVFIAMHGEYGEDGTVQKLLTAAHLRFTGSSSKASALGMDKAASSELFAKAGLLIPPFMVIKRSDRGGIAHDFKFPVVVKPADRGSSVGVSICGNEDEFLRGLSAAFASSERVMVQDFIAGREITCGVLEGADGKTFALPPTEIIPKRGTFFDYASKYVQGGSDEITPPDLPPDVIKEIQDIALKCHHLIEASGMSRTDMIIGSEDSKIYVLEINTIPGMTETSLLPQEAKKAGIGFGNLLDLIIASGSRANRA